MKMFAQVQIFFILAISQIFASPLTDITRSSALQNARKSIKNLAIRECFDDSRLYPLCVVESSDCKVPDSNEEVVISDDTNNEAIEKSTTKCKEEIRCFYEYTHQDEYEINQRSCFLDKKSSGICDVKDKVCSQDGEFLADCSDKMVCEYGTVEK